MLDIEENTAKIVVWLLLPSALFNIQKKLMGFHVCCPSV